MGSRACYRFLVFLLLLNGAFSAVDSGKEFITGFMQNTNSTKGANSLKLIITAFYGPTSVSISIANTKEQWTVALRQGETQSVIVPPSSEMIGSTSFPSSVLITTDKDISVVSVSEKPQSVGTAALVPAAKLGKQYYVVTPSGHEPCAFKEFSVINYKSRNKVIIEFTSYVTYNGDVYSPKKKLVAKMEPYQALQVQSADDLSGTYISADQFVAVLAGYSCILQERMCDHSYEQLLPLPSWQTNFLVPSLPSKASIDIVYVVASIKKTKLEIISGRNKQKVGLERGEVFQLQVKFSASFYIISSESIQVLYYSTGGSSPSRQSGSSVINLPDTSKFCRSYLVYGLDDFDNSAIIVANNTAKEGFALDGQPLDDIKWNKMAGTEYSWGSVTFSSEVGSHMVEHPDTEFGLLNIGSASQRAYGSHAICNEVERHPGCTLVQCNPEETCRIVDEVPVCVQNWETICIAWSGSHYLTFDGFKFDFQGTCSYTMAESCGEDSDLPVFNVAVKTENRGSRLAYYVSMLTIQVYEHNISIAHLENGLVRVNNVRAALPITLNDGSVQIQHSGQYARVETDYGLQILFDWKAMVIVRVPRSFIKNVCGLCGNNNQNPKDDFTMESGELATSAREFGASWKSKDSDATCKDDCKGATCKDKPESQNQKSIQKYSGREFCGLLADNSTGPFRLCHSQLDPAPFVQSCANDMSNNKGLWNVLCQAFTTYAVICQNSGIQIFDWRDTVSCPPECPANSTYDTCGTACPETCAPTNSSTSCSHLCVESCSCDDGFSLSEGKCIVKSQCGCSHEGRTYALNKKFWLDNCQKHCICNPLTRLVECKESKCRKEEYCGVKKGVLNCYPNQTNVCSASGDPHFTTFDGLRYDFMGTCVYLFSRLCQLYTGLVDFKVNVQSEKRSNKDVSYTKTVEITVYGTQILISKEYPKQVRLNGLLISLPYNFEKGKIQMQKKGRTAVIQTDFGFKLTFDWWSRVTLTLPSSYARAVCGLCGNFDNDKTNDLIKEGETVPSNVTEFGSSWKMKDIPGCSAGTVKECPKMDQMMNQQKKSKTNCGLLLDASGPFRDCRSTVDPQGFFQDCVYDFCYYEGKQEIICQMVSAYTAACQESGAKVYPWRSESFCPMNCPVDSHYDICESGCGLSCSDAFTPSECNTTCKESCVCEKDFLLSDDECVTLEECGCTYNGFYYKKGTMFYPEESCSTQCNCRDGGSVACKDHSCGPNEACMVVDGVRNCQASGSATCSASGGSHYWTFDKMAFDYVGNCSYTLAKTCLDNATLDPFSVTIENEMPADAEVVFTKMVNVEAYGYKISLMRKRPWMLQVNGVLHNLPYNVPDGKLRVFQKGIHAIVSTAFGLKVRYDLAYYVNVVVPSNYKKQVCGLCGSYSESTEDEFLLPDNTRDPDVTTFAAAWRVPLPNEVCSDGCGGASNPCAPCDQRGKEIYKQISLCGILTAPGGPFSVCYPVVNSSVYFEQCMKDLCMNNGDSSRLCYNIQSYVAECQAAKVKMRAWRTESFCPLSCPEDSHYSLCTDICSASCSQITDPAKCPTGCAEGCQCDDGFLANGEDCVPLGTCGSFHNGVFFKVGEQHLMEGCEEYCKWSSSGAVSCEASNCTAERCEVKNETRVCVNPDRECGPNSHFSACVDVCNTTCAGIAKPEACSVECTHGCECDEGFVNDTKECVTADICYCFLHETRYKIGGQMMQEHCRKLCTCTSSGSFTCVPNKCPKGEVCDTADGKNSCIKKDFNCTANSHYTDCVDVCATSCGGLREPATCQSSCTEGCQCDAGFVMDGPKCVSIGTCGCYHNGTTYKVNDKFLTDDCKKQCTCSTSVALNCVANTCGKGELCEATNKGLQCASKDLCRNIKCRSKESCEVIEGSPKCVPDFYGTCWGWGDPHYHTYDDYSFNFQGTCTYVITKYCGNDATLVPFLIDEKNDNRANRGVSYVRQINIYVYGFNISLHKGETGKIRLNNIIAELPVVLGEGKVRVFQSGMGLALYTDFDLKVFYDWRWELFISLPSSYYGTVCGLCGNFNNNPRDDMRTPSGKAVTSVVDWSSSWKTIEPNSTCWDFCPDGANCPTFDENNIGPYGGRKHCGLMAETIKGPFSGCHSTLDSDEFLNNCIYDVVLNGGAKTMLCQALKSYGSICRKKGASVTDWRKLSGCRHTCPENSHYEPCGNVCPPSCADRNGPKGCNLNCSETCQCNTGFFLSGDKCVPAESCGCTYKGRYYQPSETFWTDTTCKERCTCDAAQGKVTCQNSPCKTMEKCSVVNGILGCYPTMFAKCASTGDPHYNTFDGQKYNFMGTCIYQLVGLCSNDPTLTPFSIKVLNDNRGNKAVSFTKAVTLELYGQNITLSRDARSKIQVNGIFVALPYKFQTNRIIAHRSGWKGVVKTNFSLTLTFDWKTTLTVTLPSTYSGAVCGLCGNYNQKKEDDFTLRNGLQNNDPIKFGHGWKIADVPGCTPECTKGCPVCTDKDMEVYKVKTACGILTDKSGPFKACHSTISPAAFFDDCIYDACQYKGFQTAICDGIRAYVDACQGAQIQINEWRTKTFCGPTCSQNFHYELCGTGCPITCSGLSAPAGCDAPCTEGCVCDRGFLLSGDTCVPIKDCGSVFNNTYYQQGQEFYLGDNCQQHCKAVDNGEVDCQPHLCASGEECKVNNGVRGCYPAKSGVCITSGDPHYRTFDGVNFEFQGTCTYILAKLQSNGTEIPDFSVAVKNEKYKTSSTSVVKAVNVYVNNYTITLERAMNWKVKINDILSVLPLTLMDGAIQINQEGNNRIIRTGFGLKILYDSMYYVSVEIPSNFKGQMRGLCGNFNNDRNDDFRLPTGVKVNKADDFGAAWKMDTSESECTQGCGNNCPSCSASNTQAYSKTSSCGMISDPNGPFKSCHEEVSPIDYLNFCLYDMCAVSDQTDILCKNLQAYTAACQAAGETVEQWRTTAFCPLACPANSHYESCTHTCESTCASVTEPPKCGGECFEGCACDGGYLADGDSCVSMENCGCVYKGQYIPHGGSIMNEDCSEQCTCQSGVVGIQCSAYSCPVGSACTVKDGVRSCLTMFNMCTFPVASIVKTLGNVARMLLELSYSCSAADSSFYSLMFTYNPSIFPGGVSLGMVTKAISIDLRSSKEVRVSNNPVSLPYTGPKGIYVEATQDGIILKQGTMMRITVSSDGTVTVGMSPTRESCGICSGSANKVITVEQVSKHGRVTIRP